MNHNEIETFLSSINIPEIKTKPKTFLGIAKQPHYENVLSNLYAFYFDVDEEHGLGDLFLSSLLELIQQSEIGKGKSIPLDDGFDIETEYSTLKGGRIDLLLSNDEHAIIIENKVYHALINNLDDYWESIECSSEENKIGIVLSLYEITPIKNPNFINITHLGFLKCVMANSGKYLLNATDKYLVYLKDLYQNIINLSTNNIKKKDLEFYLNNQRQICEVKDFESAVRKHFYSQINDACSLFEQDLVLGAKFHEKWRYYISPNHHNLMLTVVFEQLLDPAKRVLHVVVELKHQALDNREKYKSIEFSEYEKAIIKTDFYDLKENWAHFATVPYDNILVEQLNDFSTFIYNAFKDSYLLSIFNKLEDFLTREEAKKELVEID